jgi:tetratricopeptide (TPR) repeat protein
MPRRSTRSGTREERDGMTMGTHGFKLGLGAVAVSVLVGCETTPRGREGPPAERNAVVVQGPAALERKNAEDRKLAVELIYMSGCEFLSKSEVDAALSELTKCLSLDPTYAPAYFKRSLCYYAKELYALEIADLEKAILYDPTYLEAHLNLANALLSQDRPEPALTEYMKVIELDPNHPLAFYNSGLILGDLGQFDRAVEHLRRAQETGAGLLRKDILEKKIPHYMERFDRARARKGGK